MSRHYNHMQTTLLVDGVPIPASNIEYQAGVVKFAVNISENSSALLVQNLGRSIPFELGYSGNNCDSLKLLFAALSASKPTGTLKLDSFSLEESDDCKVVFNIE